MRNLKRVAALISDWKASRSRAGRITKARHLLQGTGYGVVPPNWEKNLADTLLRVSDDEAVLYRRLLAEKEGLHVGFSAGANVCAAAKLLASGRIPSDGTVVTLLCDTGLKYPL